MSDSKYTIIQLIANDYLDVPAFKDFDDGTIQKTYELPLTWIEEALEAAFDAGKRGNYIPNNN